MSVKTITETTLNRFYNICEIPHGSGNEKEIGLWLQKWANEHRFACSTDEVGNVIINVPGKGNLSSKPYVVLQGHMDMVCVKDADSDHDFSKDSIKTYIENGWMRAKGTTLGADNGIAIAIAMAIAENDQIQHPPLELLFTVDEERGLTGANHLKPNTLKGKILLNLDSEEEGEFTIGCAGGRDSHIELDLETVKLNCKKQIVIRISGLYGGHSGMEINQPRANAIQLAARLLNQACSVCPIYLSDINAGLAHNAIPRDAYASFYAPENQIENILASLNSLKSQIISEFSFAEKQMDISIEKLDCICDNDNCECTIYSSESTSKIINLLFALPHGVCSLVPGNNDLVETSNNLAIVKIENNKLQILTSQRSSLASKNDYITNKIEAVAKLAGAKVESGNGYPSWQPNWDSALLKKCKEVYSKLYNQCYSRRTGMRYHRR